jgi:uncharacterized Zn finger protein (UPF0148 family)
MKNTSNQETNLSTAVKQRSKRLPTQCKICGALALYSHFGVVVCPSCKMFFKRNAQKNQVRSNHTHIFFLYRFVLGSIQVYLSWSL